MTNSSQRRKFDKRAFQADIERQAQARKVQENINGQGHNSNYQAVASNPQQMPSTYISPPPMPAPVPLNYAPRNPVKNTNSESGITSVFAIGEDFNKNKLAVVLWILFVGIPFGFFTLYTFLMLGEPPQGGFINFLSYSSYRSIVPAFFILFARARKDDLVWQRTATRSCYVVALTILFTFINTFF